MLVCFMRKDHRPFIVKKAYLRYQKFYTRRYIRPQLDHLGKGFVFMKPWCVEIFGPSVCIGDYATVIASPDKRVRLSVWTEDTSRGYIRIGDYCLICPGVRLSSTLGIHVGNSVMMASGVYITDSDWHGIYDRTAKGEMAMVRVEDNVWLGDSAIICKGVTIGKNTIVGAGAVVRRDVPENVIVAGNPARVIRELDPDKSFTPRANWFQNPKALARDFEQLDREQLMGNTFSHWLRYILSPKKDE